MIRTIYHFWLLNELAVKKHAAQALYALLCADPLNTRLSDRLSGLYAQITKIETILNINPVNTVEA